MVNVMRLRVGEMILHYLHGPPKAENFFWLVTELWSQRFRAWAGSQVQLLAPRCRSPLARTRESPGSSGHLPAGSQQGSRHLSPTGTTGFCQHPSEPANRSLPELLTRAQLANSWTLRPRATECLTWGAVRLSLWTL